MSPETLEATLDFIARIAVETRRRKVRVTFHGGEPLMAGHAIWRQALDGFRTRLGPKRYEVAIQSNLWLLDDEFCQLFREHLVRSPTPSGARATSTARWPASAGRGPGA